MTRLPAYSFLLDGKAIVTKDEAWRIAANIAKLPELLLGKTNAAILDFLLKGDSGAAMTENWFIARLRNFGPIEWFTLVLCVVGYVQYLAFVQSESAFVFPAGLEFTDPLGAETAQPILLDIDIANSGKSAATITEFVAFVAHELPERPNYEQTGLNQVRTGIAPVPAAGKIRQSLRFSDWGQETMLAVKSGTRGFYLWGELTYKDEARHFTEAISDFCFAYFANKQNADKSVFRTCPNVNFTRTRTRLVW